jgi:hypothetical protein
VRAAVEPQPAVTPELSRTVSRAKKAGRKTECLAPSAPMTHRAHRELAVLT